MKIFDTHFHLLPEDDLKSMNARALANGVSTMLVAGSPIQEVNSMLDRISSYPNIWAAIGVHPHEASGFDGDLGKFECFSGHSKVKAIGEIGLDYFYKNSEPQKQKAVFRAFLELAKKEQLPSVIHCRDAFEDCFDLIKEILEGKLPFVIHCFTGSLEWAERFIGIGGYLSFNGIITFKKSDRLRALLKEVPKNRLLFETDSPYLTPVPHRGKKNEPAYLPFILKRAAVELNLELSELATISTQNAETFFNIPSFT